ncbi:MAG: hypothetical protein WC708_05200 [Lentisphaeria bacterium]
MRPVPTLAAAVFAAVCAGHAVRLFLRWEVVLNGWHIPLWPSWFGLAATGALAALLWREARHR